MSTANWTHTLARKAGEVRAAFILNGKPKGVPDLFLNRTAAFDRGAGRLPGVEGLMDTAPAVPIEFK